MIRYDEGIIVVISSGYSFGFYVFCFSSKFFEFVL